MAEVTLQLSEEKIAISIHSTELIRYTCRQKIFCAFYTRKFFSVEYRLKYGY